MTARDVRTLVEELWLAGAEAIAVNGERIVGSSAVLDIGGSILVNSAYLAPPYTVTAIGPPDLYDRLRASVAFVAVRPGPDRAGRASGCRSPSSTTVDLPAFAGTVEPALRQPARRAEAPQRRDRGPTPHDRSSQPSDASPPWRRCSGSSPSASCGARPACPACPRLSATELTQLIANLTTGNDQLRDEVAELSRQEAHLAEAQRPRRDDGRRADRRPRRGSAPGPASPPVTGQGIAITVQRRRSAATASRSCSTSCATPAPRRSRSTACGSWRASSSRARRARCRSRTQPLGDAFEIRAIGSPQILTGTLTRTGGVIAQVGATYPDGAPHASRPVEIDDAPRDGSRPRARPTPNPASDTAPADVRPGPRSSCSWATSSGSGEPIPCGASEWLVDRLGADIGLRCQGCGRHVLLERRLLEARLAGFVSRGDPAMSAAVAPRPALEA